MRAAAVTVLISALLASAAPAQAQAPAATGVAGDVRCLLTMAALSGNKANQPQSTFGLFYFAGRIKAQNPGFNFGTQLKPVAMTMKPADFEAEVKRCGPMVQAVASGMQAAQASMGPPPGAAPGPAAPLKK